jgi:hypothetical protein
MLIFCCYLILWTIICVSPSLSAIDTHLRRAAVKFEQDSVHEGNNGSHHSKMSHALMETKGLKNSEVAVFVTSTSSKHGKYLLERYVRLLCPNRF